VGIWEALEKLTGTPPTELLEHNTESQDHPPPPLPNHPAAHHGQGVLQPHDGGHKDGDGLIPAEEGGRHRLVGRPELAGHTQEAPLVVANQLGLPGSHGGTFKATCQVEGDQ
jgi:hypothetical protein